MKGLFDAWHWGEGRLKVNMASESACLGAHSLRRLRMPRVCTHRLCRANKAPKYMCDAWGRIERTLCVRILQTPRAMLRVNQISERTMGNGPQRIRCGITQIPSTESEWTERRKCSRMQGKTQRKLKTNNQPPSAERTEATISAHASAGAIVR